MDKKFFCDIMLGKLSKYLRQLGIDTAYSRSIAYPQLIKIALKQNRTILTRKTGFLKINDSISCCFINSNNPYVQIQEVIKHFKIAPDDLKPFSLCLLCNAVLQKIDRNLAEGKIPDYIFNTVDTYSQCPGCLRIYWPGTHYKKMLGYSKSIFNPLRQYNE